MKKSMTFKFFAFALIALMVASCSKYEDGSNFTILSKKARMVNTWTMTQTTQTLDINGATVDVTALMPSIVLDLKKDGSGTLTTSGTVAGVPFTTVDPGTWAFNSDKSNLILTNAAGEVTTAKIIMLKNKDLKVSTNANGFTTTTTYKGE